MAPPQYSSDEDDASHVVWKRRSRVRTDEPEDSATQISHQSDERAMTQLGARSKRQRMSPDEEQEIGLVFKSDIERSARAPNPINTLDANVSMNLTLNLIG
ncbi:hypothetical protein DPMN_090204 [Dreissena polymorpha]|uniref:Uncharacterized protein n=2 Tax=Dreissena polymorpha TaxID=45954 RepID=A0A9D4KY69_DREPO|nr:hypothetical protein DPMN_090204 [Dreissena polymorpha]